MIQTASFWRRCAVTLTFLHAVGVLYCLCAYSTLEQALASRDMELSRKNLLIQQLMAARQQQQQQPQQQSCPDDG